MFGKHFGSFYLSIREQFSWDKQNVALYVKKVLVKSAHVWVLSTEYPIKGHLNVKTSNYAKARI